MLDWSNVEGLIAYVAARFPDDPRAGDINRAVAIAALHVAEDRVVEIVDVIDGRLLTDPGTAAALAEAIYLLAIPDVRRGVHRAVVEREARAVLWDAGYVRYDDRGLPMPQPQAA